MFQLLFLLPVTNVKRAFDQGILKGGSITVPLTSCLTGLESANNFCLYVQNRLIQTSQIGGQWYSDTVFTVSINKKFFSVTEGGTR